MTDLHLQVLVQQGKSQASITNAQEATIRRQTKPSEVLKQHHTIQLRMFSHRWRRIDLQPPTLWRTQEHVSDHSKSADAALENSSLQITLIVSSRDERSDEIKTATKSSRSCSDTCNCGFFEGNITEQCSLNNSSLVSVECEDSDLSDLEKDNITVSNWAAPVELELRPESVDRYLDLTDADEEQVYPDVLPLPLEDLESLDPHLTALVTRLLELEKLQTLTIQKEKGKAVRSRPATAFVRRRVESPGLEHMRIRGHNSVLVDLSKLSLSSSSHSQSRRHTRPLSHSHRAQSGLQQQPTFNSKAVKLKNSKGLTCSFSNVSPKCNNANTSKTRKPSKKDIPK